MLRSFILIGTLCFNMFVFGQSSTDTAAQLFTPEQLKSDFALLNTCLQEVHPSIHHFITEDNLNHLAEHTINQLSTPLTELEFHLIVRKFIRNIRCGHTTAKPSIPWYLEQKIDSKLLPFEIMLLNDKIYVKEAYDGRSILVAGVEISSIDDRPSSEIIHEMRSIQQVDGYSSTFENKAIEKLFRTYHLFLFGRKDNYKIQYVNFRKDTSNIHVKAGILKPEEDEAAKKEGIHTSASSFYLFEDKPGFGVLDINDFATKGFRKYYRTVFKEVQKNKIDNLVVDLRGNEGGFLPNGNRLLRYFIDEKFSMKFSRPKNRVKEQSYLTMPSSSRITRRLFALMPDKDKKDPRRNFEINYTPMRKNKYEGRLFVIIDGGTFSTGSLVATKLKQEKNCTLIGEETGGSKRGSNAILSYDLILPETKIQISIPYYFLDHDIDGIDDGKGLIPDFAIDYNLWEKLQMKDKEMEQVEFLLNQKL